MGYDITGDKMRTETPKHSEGLGQGQPQELIDYPTLTNIVKGNTLKHHILHCKTVSRGMNGYF